MMSNRDASALLDIYNAATKILDFSSGYDDKKFLADQRTQSAILHELMIIGEAVKRLSVEFRLNHPDVRWTPMAGMRDVLIHAYDTVDLEEVWRTVTSDIPPLVVRLTPLLPTDHEE